MKVLAASDIHGDIQLVKKLADKAEGIEEKIGKTRVINVVRNGKSSNYNFLNLSS